MAIVSHLQNPYVQTNAAKPFVIDDTTFNDVQVALIFFTLNCGYFATAEAFFRTCHDSAMSAGAPKRKDCRAQYILMITIPQKLVQHF